MYRGRVVLSIAVLQLLSAPVVRCTFIDEINCLPVPRQGAATVNWHGTLLVVGGSTSPGKCLPPYTEWPTVYIGNLTDEGPQGP